MRLNLGKKGASLSLGPRGGKITVGAKGVRTTVGLPGTGLFATDYRKWPLQHEVQKARTDTSPFDSPAPRDRIQQHEVEKTGSDTDHAPDQSVPNWQFYLFQKLLNQRIGGWEHAWSEATVGNMDVLGFCQWGKDHMNRLTALINRLVKFFEVDTVDAINAPESPAKITRVIDGIAEEVTMIIQWEEEVRVFAEHPVFGGVARMMSGMSWVCMETIKNIKAQLDEQLVTVAQTKRIFLNFKMSALPHIDALLIALKELETKALPQSGRIRGDFLQMRFRVNRNEVPLGHFSRKSVLENCVAGLFRPSDVYWSENEGAWRRLDELETEGSIAFGELSGGVG